MQQLLTILALTLVLITGSATAAGNFLGAEPYPGDTELYYYPPETHPAPRQKVRVADKHFWVLADVVPPTIHAAQMLDTIAINSGETVLDIGTGSGVLAIFAADHAKQVIATDINPKAAENARFNIRNHGVEHIVSVRVGDLFGPLQENEQFDVIFSNLPYPYNAQTLHFWDLHERFFRDVKAHLKPNGRIYYQAGYLYNLKKVQSMIEEHGLQFEKINIIDVPRYNRQPFVVTIKVKQ
jgi:release factor glutamine methyltransferase